MVTNTSYRHIIGMERISHTADYFMKYELLNHTPDERRRLFLNMIKSVATLVNNIQQKYNKISDRL